MHGYGLKIINGLQIFDFAYQFRNTLLFLTLNGNRMEKKTMKRTPRFSVFVKLKWNCICGFFTKNVEGTYIIHS